MGERSIGNWGRGLAKEALEREKRYKEKLAQEKAEREAKEKNRPGGLLYQGEEAEKQIENEMLEIVKERDIKRGQLRKTSSGKEIYVARVGSDGFVYALDVSGKSEPEKQKVRYDYRVEENKRDNLTQSERENYVLPGSRLDPSEILPE